MAGKTSSRKATTTKTLHEFFAPAMASPAGFTTLDPVDELTTALDWRMMELINLYDYMNKPGSLRPTPAIIEQLFTRRRLRDAVQYFYHQLLEQGLDVRQLQSKRKPQRKEGLIGPAIEHAFSKRTEWREEEKRLWWKDFSDFMALPGDSPTTRRQRRSRARRKA